MYMNNLTTRELYASMSNSADVVALFTMGININNSRLAVSAMEDLIRRKDYVDVVDVIDKAIEDDGALVQGSSLMSLMMRSLAESVKGNESYLGVYARDVLNGLFVGPRAWLRANPEAYRPSPRLRSREIERLSDGTMVLPGNDR